MPAAMDYVFAVLLVKISSPTIMLASIIGGFAASRPVHVFAAAVIVAFLDQLFYWSYEKFTNSACSLLPFRCRRH